MIELGVPVDVVEPKVGGAGEVVDDSAFAAWYRHEHPRLLASMTIVTRDLHTAQDVTSEAFARALAAWSRVSNMDSPTGWTYRVALNIAKRRARRAAVEARLLRRIASVDHTAPSEHAIEVWDAVRALPPRARTAIALRYTAGLTEAEVAAAMHIAVGTASATLAAARKSLAITLGEPEAAKPDAQGSHDG